MNFITKDNLKSKSWCPEIFEKNKMKLTILSRGDAQDSEFRSFFGRIKGTINCF